RSATARQATLGWTTYTTALAIQTFSTAARCPRRGALSADRSTLARPSASLAARTPSPTLRRPPRCWLALGWLLSWQPWLLQPHCS
ncbi:hypothetical protein IWW38_001991, partial [Coemansia aciculifera]